MKPRLNQEGELEHFNVFASRPDRTRLIAILLAGLIVRFGLLIFTEIRPELFDFPDTRRYLQVAENIAVGRGPIESDRVLAGTDPLYPYILSIPFEILPNVTEEALFFGRVVNIFCGLFAIALLADIAGRLFGKRVAVIACMIFVFDPIIVFFHGLVLTEVIYIMLMLAGFSALVRFRQSASLYSTIWAGVFLGAAALARSSGILMPIMLLPFIWYFAKHAQKRRTIFARAIVITIFISAVAVMLVPTVVRNYRLFGHFVPVRTGVGASLMEALGPWADGGPGMDRIRYPEFPEVANEFERDLLCRQAAMSWAKAHPADAFALAWAKLKRTWSVTMNATGYSSWKYDLICWLTVAPIFVLALIGIWLLKSRPWDIALLLVPAVYFTLLHVVFVGSVRYRVPAMPFLFVLASVPLSRIRFLRTESSVV